MSRRFRDEEEKLRALKDELQEEEDKMKLMTEKIFSPLIWRRYQNGIKIKDLQENRFYEVIEMILKYYLPEDVLCRNTKIGKDKVSQQCFADRLFFKLKDRASVIAVDEKNDNCLAGVLVLNPVQKCDYGRVYSRAMLVDGNSYKSITEFMNHINRKVDIFEEFQCEIYLRYYLLCVKPEYRHRALGMQLMMVGLDIARHLKIPVVTGVFNNYRLQQIARRIGIDQVLYEYNYNKWSDKNHELIFCNPGAGNYTCNIQAGLVPAPPEPEPTPVKGFEVGGGVTRADKKKAKAKNDAKKKTK
ncbi:unnamed protein product [Ceutorhynchus assimilis]|uniref:N-acetyltransferase domain-containing protein n=1 Tax=Ceutorhynchus assimilis TaxID=467358 RepID=A0A9N9MQW0_9CUCU|nr:unnamed protein product [Ceutorhynchus assimilis]